MERLKQKVKLEYNSICRLCLSDDRTLIKIGDEYFLLYQTLTSNLLRDSCDMRSLICWECRAKFRKIKEFQQQVEAANSVLLSGMPHGSLSTLNIGIGHEFTFEEETESGSTREGGNNGNHNQWSTELTIKPLTEFKIINIEANVLINNETTNTDEILDETELKKECDDSNGPFSENFNSFETNDDVYNENLKSPETVTKKEKNSVNLDKNIDKCKHNIVINKKEETTDEATNSKAPQKKYYNSDKARFIEIPIEEFKVTDHFDKCLRENVHNYTSKDKEYKYKCASCDLYFEKNLALVVHNKLHKVEKPFYACDICSRTQSTKVKLAKHIFGRHKMFYKCRLCGLGYNNTKDSFFHYKSAHRKQFECLECHMRYSVRSDMYSHWDSLHRKYKCDYCGAQRSKKEYLVAHMESKHLFYQYKCDACNRKFKYKHVYQTHMKTFHHPNPTPAYCVECDMHFDSVFLYKRHLSSSKPHKGNRRKTVQCPECKRFFKGNAYMQDHYDFVHLKKYKYRCEECDHNFARKHKLDEHNKRQHLGILPPKNKMCKICGRGFSSNTILTHHLRTHTGERPYACSCGAAFAQRYTLATHAAKQGHTALFDNKP